MVSMTVSNHTYVLANLSYAIHDVEHSGSVYLVCNN